MKHLFIASLAASLCLTSAARASDQVLVPWNGMDIGKLVPEGKATDTNGTIAITASGSEPNVASDQFHFVYQSRTGDFTFIARVTVSGAPNSDAQAGLMDRDALATTSNFAGVALAPAQGVLAQYRNAFAPVTSSVTGSVGGKSSGPIWLRLVKRGTGVESSFAPDVNAAPGRWKKIGASEPIASGMIYVGLSLTQPHVGLSSTASFDHVALTEGAPSAVEDGAYFVVPASAPALRLDAAGAGKTNGTGVDITTPGDTPAQKWVFTAKGNGVYAIRPFYDASLALTVAGANAASGTKVVLQTDQNLDSQRWKLIANANGTYGLSPRCAPESGLDDFGGSTAPGTLMDIWQFLPDDPHTQWLINPVP